VILYGQYIFVSPGSLATTTMQIVTRLGGKKSMYATWTDTTQIIMPCSILVAASKTQRACRKLRMVSLLELLSMYK